MQAHDQAIIHGSEEANWRTPQPCFDRLNTEFHFFADLAASRESNLASFWYGPDHASEKMQDALTIDWSEVLVGKTAFLNPPFSKTLLNAYNTGRIKRDGVWVEHEKNPVKGAPYDIANWAKKCWEESQRGATIVGIFPFAPQTDWYTKYVYGIKWDNAVGGWSGHAAMEERRLPHRISFLRPNGEPAGNAGVNSAIIVWRPNPGYIGAWQPAVRYWSYR